MNKKLFAVAVFVFSLAFYQIVEAATVAVFPVEDLSDGLNGVDFELTEDLVNDLEAKGLDVIASQEVISFMARNRIRRLGFLDTVSIFQARDELGADFILYGSVYSREENSSPTLGLNLYLVRTDDARIIWSNSGGVSRASVQHLLGISEPTTKLELLAVLKENILSTWPRELEFAERQQLSLEIEKVNLAPKYIRPGDEVVCSVRLRPSWSSKEVPRVFFKVRGRVYLASELEGGNQYKAKWIGSDRDGSYPVTLVVNWPSGRKKIAFIGTYFIDSTPPKVSLNLKGVRLKGTVAFRDQVLIIPHMMEREPISRWKISVINEAGDELMSDSGEGNLPQRFVWRGQLLSGKPADEGIYQIILKSWDRSQNMGIASQHVMFSRTPPAMVLEATNQGNDVTVDISNEGKVPIAFWRMDMYSDDGGILKSVDGENLPARVEYSGHKSADKQKVKCIIVLKDILGNEVRREIDDIQLFAEMNNQPVNEPEITIKDSNWVEEF
ncbi:hypothetical protein ACFL6N_01635 [Thermodesulfobacteriota bacterium]